jgi:hypothetical protein
MLSRQSLLLSEVEGRSIWPVHGWHRRTAVKLVGKDERFAGSLQRLQAY